MDKLQISKKHALKTGAEVTVPPSKSLSNRALLIASLGKGTIRLENVLNSDDTQRMIAALKALKVNIREEHAGTLMVEGRGSLFSVKEELILDLGNAGTAMRPLCAALAVSDGTFTLTGTKRMMERPIGPLVAALTRAGCKICCLNTEGFPPLKISGSHLKTNKLRISGSTSSQFVNALLMIGPMLPQGLELSIEDTLISRPYVDLTLSMIKDFGGRVERKGYEFFKVEPIPYQNPGTFTIESDASSASYFMAMGAIAGPLIIRGLKASSVQGDLKFVDVLRRMGADVRMGDDYIEVHKSRLSGIEIDMNDMPDAAMTLVPLALFCNGPIAVHNVASWRVKETDRLDALAAEMGKMGIKVKCGRDYIIVDGSVRNDKTPVFATYNDHRMAMCMSLAAFDRDIVIEDPNCTAKTFPGYFEIFNKITV